MNAIDLDQVEVSPQDAVDAAPEREWALNPSTKIDDLVERYDPEKAIQRAAAAARASGLNGFSISIPDDDFEALMDAMEAKYAGWRREDHQQQIGLLCCNGAMRVTRQAPDEVELLRDALENVLMATPDMAVRMIAEKALKESESRGDQ